MRSFIFAFLFLLLLTASGGLQCKDGEDYLRIVKKTRMNGNNEIFTITDDAQSSDLFVSPEFYDNETRVMETCIKANENHRYQLVMKNRYQRQWSSGAWVELYGVNGNMVLKVAQRLGDSKFILYSPVNKGDRWTFSNEFSGKWRELDFDDSDWKEVVLGKSTVQSTGTQYFRTIFDGASDISVYEIRFRYSHGIVAYIDGIEIYRDNMPEGEPTAGTLATRSYATLEYRGVLRSADIIKEMESILAVELHFTDADHTQTIDFDAFLAFLITSSDHQCLLVPYPLQVVSGEAAVWENAFNWSIKEYAELTSFPASATVAFSDPNLRAVVNRLRVLTNGNLYYFPSSFTVTANEGPNTPWTPLFSLLQADVKGHNQGMEFWNVGTTRPISAYNITLSRSVKGPTHLFEIQFFICSLKKLPTFYYQNVKNNGYPDHNAIVLSSTLSGFSDCTAEPALPESLTLNPLTCDISGSSSENKEYKITGHTSNGDVKMSARILTKSCSSGLMRIVRTYKDNPELEGYQLQNGDTPEVALENLEYANEDVVRYYCAEKGMNVSLIGSTPYWDKGSTISIYHVISKTEEELLYRSRFDSFVELPTVQRLRVFVVEHDEEWFYHMGSVPDNWTGNNITSWEKGSHGNFPDSTNQIQLYKKVFSLKSLDDVSGLVLSIRYVYGCVVYLNGYEVFRNRVDGEVSDKAFAKGSYDKPLYRVITIPRESNNAASGESTQYLRVGDNVIAIALVAENAESQKQSVFDAMVRPMMDMESHIYDFSATSDGIDGDPKNPFIVDHEEVITGKGHDSNSLIVTLDNDRREWVNAVEIQNAYDRVSGGVSGFNLYGRNGNDEWKLLKKVTGVTYSRKSHRRRIYFRNDLSFNQFKFENFVSDDEEWVIQSLNLVATVVPENQDPLSYESVTVFKDVEMSELIPANAVGYSNFRVSPELPKGLVIDSQNGWISGTATVEKDLETYLVVAETLSGETVTANFNLTVKTCQNRYGLVTMRFFTDNIRVDNWWKLYAGREASGTPIQSVSAFPVTDSLYYVDMCLQRGVYTFQAGGSKSGWKAHTGYTMTVDMGAMELDVQELGSSKGSVTTVFSSFFPFQVGYSSWKVYQDTVPSDWNMVDFDDSEWESFKAADIPATSHVTTYLRKSFSLTTASAYQVLNVRMKYTGGVAVYRNGILVGLFNMKRDFDSETESLTRHDPNSFSKFHILLNIPNKIGENNVIAFEIHRPKGSTEKEPVVFDATGVFGVDECSPVVDSFSSVISEGVDGDIHAVTDLDPHTWGEMKGNGYIQWTVENLMGSKWNAFVVLGSRFSNMRFSLYGYPEPNSNRYAVLSTDSQQSAEDREKFVKTSSMGMTSSRQYRLLFNRYSPTDSILLDSVHFAYCKKDGTHCPAQDEYPSTFDGGMSIVPCAFGYSGYSFRSCYNGRLGKVDNSTCELQAPTAASYSKTHFTFVVGTTVTTEAPTVDSVEITWKAKDELPEGLSINENTGVISGIPTTELNTTAFVVYAKNDKGMVPVSLKLTVRKGRCNAEGFFPATVVGETAIVKCSQQGHYMGTMHRKCFLGEKDGIWGITEGRCFAIPMVVTVTVLGIVIVAGIVYIAIKIHRRKPTPGKAKKSLLSSNAGNRGKESRV